MLTKLLFCEINLTTVLIVVCIPVELDLHFHFSIKVTIPKVIFLNVWGQCRTFSLAAGTRRRFKVGKKGLRLYCQMDLSRFFCSTLLLWGVDQT